MNKILIVIMMTVIAASVSGCVGTSALRIATVPDGAKLYANDKYIGVTPRSIPVDYGYLVFYSWCDATRIKIEKEGYQVVEENITRSKLGRRNRNSSYSSSSEFGSGRTYEYLYYLTPKK